MAGDGSTAGGGASMGGTASQSGSASTMGGAGGVGGSEPVQVFGGAATWDPLSCHASPVPEPSDPTSREQWALARAFCLALEPACFQTGAVLAARGCSGDQAVEECVAEVLWFHQQNVSVECEDVWRSDIQCGSRSSLSGAACFDVGTMGPYGTAESCAGENAALRGCMAMHSTDVEVAGSYTTCSYSTASASASTCVVTCPLDEYSAALTCSGPPGLPKQCGCAINGHVLPLPQPIFVSDCADAAAQGADGLCTSRLDCCFEYLDRDKQACRCEQPVDFGYDSCEAMMAVAQGRQVSICPALLPDDGGGCWPPGSCPP
jgi:hypothetical protein